MKLRLPQTPAARLALVLPLAAGVGVLLYFRGPDWAEVGDAFAYVRWELVAAAIGWNVLSVIARSIAWRTVIAQAIPPPLPGYRLVFSAFSVGLFANVVLPGRVGEIARIAVLTRRLPPREGTWPRLFGSVVAHRIFDLVPSLILIAYVLLAARVPAWASTSLVIVLILGIGFIGLALAAARRHNRLQLDREGRVKRVVAHVRVGLAVMRTPRSALLAVFFQCLGWLCQFFAVWTTLIAFNLHLGPAAAALVLVLINVATIIPLWPGNLGIVQAAIAVPLNRYYGVPYDKGFAFGIGLQAIEASVGIGVGLVFLAREGVSFAMLREMRAPVAEEEEIAEDLEQSLEEREPARSRVSG